VRSLTERLAALLPYPRMVRARPGVFALAPQTVVTAARGADAAGDAVRGVLAALPWPSADVAAAPGEILVELVAGLPAEGYRLSVGPGRTRIEAGGPAGAFYAAQTIRQLLPDEAWRAAPVHTEPWTIPCAEIEDEPALKWRGAHLDVARHFFPKPVMLRFIDMLAAHKLNRLHLHLSDDQGWRIESRRYPALHEVGSHRPGTQVGKSKGTQVDRSKDKQAHDNVPHGGYYTLADLAEVNAYAARRMVTVVPELEVPGHARALLAALPELAAAPGRREHTVATGWGIFPDIMAPLPQTLDVLGELFTELLGAIPAGFVHIGGDECVLTDWEADERIRDYQRSAGLPSSEALHAFFLKQVADMLAGSFNARAIVWDEGFTSTAGGTGLRQDTVVMAWHGMRVARLAAEAGYDVVAAPEDVTYFDHAQSSDDREPLSIGGLTRTEDVAAFGPVPPEWPADAAGRLLGTQFQVWTEYIKGSRALDYMTFPRACAFAEVAWSGRPAALGGRLEAQLCRLAAAGVEFRPLAGPHPWQQSGDNPAHG
jgi:hexosaminidase